MPCATGVLCPRPRSTRRCAELSRREPPPQAVDLDVGVDVAGAIRQADPFERRHYAFAPFRLRGLHQWQREFDVAVDAQDRNPGTAEESVPPPS